MLARLRAEMRSECGGERREHGAGMVRKGRWRLTPLCTNYELRITNYELDASALARGDAKRMRRWWGERNWWLVRKVIF